MIKQGHKALFCLALLSQAMLIFTVRKRVWDNSLYNNYCAGSFSIPIVYVLQQSSSNTETKYNEVDFWIKQLNFDWQMNSKTKVEKAFVFICISSCLVMRF
jgi:hypothetical protein